ncbi:hypothetical protein CK203_090530 [Vitis vinifera]|uniref:Retrovirus-related Pol polyprotein from transposon TNT 1-94 n=1 Tax=Vitis vinifera TaxID=29760 RepID=A0A438F2M7_VITVI|nr:hypothetical protein CK203_090530 [Vitis vinifera]
MEHNEHREVMQEEQVDTIDRNDKSAVDDVEENPTIENNGLEQQQEQATSELLTETQLRRSTRECQPSKWYDRTTFDHCVFVKKFSDEEFIILLLYVDDMLIVGRDAGSGVITIKVVEMCCFVDHKAEYIAITEASKELLWMKKFLQELGLQQEMYLLIVIVRGLFILVRIQLFTLDPSILM